MFYKLLSPSAITTSTCVVFMLRRHALNYLCCAISLSCVCSIPFVKFVIVIISVAGVLFRCTQIIMYSRSATRDFRVCLK